MEEMPSHFDCRLLSSIDLIPHNWTSQKGAVQSDLVCATCQRMEFKEGVICKAFQRLVLRDRFSSATFRNNRHALAMTGVTSYIGFHTTRWRGRFSIHQCQISFFHLPQTKLI